MSCQTDRGFTLPSEALEEMWTEDLALSEGTWELAREMTEEVEFHPDLPAGYPTSIAAACLWIASIIENEKRTQAVIAETVGASVTGIRNNKAEVAEIIDDSDLDAPSLHQLYEKSHHETHDETRKSWIRRLFG